MVHKKGCVVKKMNMQRGFSLCVFLFCFHCVYGRVGFNTIRPVLSRATPYIPRVVNKMCLLIPDEGPCRAEIPMYYFMPESMNCSTFRWGGCQGNGNRFDTLQECLNVCVSKPGNRPHRPTYCGLKFDYGFCFGEDKRWYYDDKWHVCRETIYSGCGGNKNNFYSQEGCESICRFGLGPPGQIHEKEFDTHKVIIVNPPDTTTRRSLNQSRG